MLYLLHTHWLWVFGALALGIIIGWITYLRAALRWTDRPVHIAIAVVALGAIVAIAKVVPVRYGYWLELGVVFSAVYTIGCFIGWALRDLAEFTPAEATSGTAKAGASAMTATAGSYLFRDALAGIATGAPYMRAASDGVPVRQPMMLDDAAAARAPAPGGYTFPTTLPFADATTRQAVASAPGVRRHWSWPRPAGVPPYVTPEFTGSKGGYMFPVATAAAATLAETSRSATTRAGSYRHWSWRGAGNAGAAAGPATSAKAAPEPQGAPVAPASAATPVTVGPLPEAPGAMPAAPAGHAATSEPQGTAADGAPLPGIDRPTGADDAAPRSAAPGAAKVEATAAATDGATTKVGSADTQPPTAASASAALGAPAPARGSAAETIPGDGVPSSTAHPADTASGDPRGGAAAAAPSPAPTAKPSTAASSEPVAVGTPGAAVSTPTTAENAASVASTPMTAASAAAGAPHGTAADAGALAASTSTPMTTRGTSPAAAATLPGAGPSARSTMVAPGVPEAAGTGAETSRATHGTASAASMPSSRPASSVAAEPSSAVVGDGSPAAEVAGGGPPGVGDGQAGVTGGSSQAPITTAPPGGDESPAAPDAATPAEAGLPAAPPTTPGQPATIAAVPGEDRHPGARPEGLMTARQNRADDLKRIRGIGPQNEGRLHGLGIWHFDQIAGWSPDNVRWVGSYLAFPGRIDREKWVEQAVTLAAGGDTGFAKRVRAGKVATSHDDGGEGQSNIVEPTPLGPTTPRRPRR